MTPPPWSPVSLQHINLVVPRGSLELAEEFYGEVLGFGSDPVPVLQRDVLRWFRIGDGPQQIHVAFEREASAPTPFPLTSRHPCFTMSSPQMLFELQKRIWEHMQRGGEASAQMCDKPGEENSGSKGVEYPTRFFARDFAGNRLEFSAPSS